MSERLGIGNMFETMELMRKAWGNLGLPSGFAPSASLEEIDKRIADLRTVEQWLNVNLNMLRSSLQALELQRMTIANMQAFGQAMAAGDRTSAGAGQGDGDAGREHAGREQPAATGEPPAMPDPAAWWNALQGQFNQIAGAALAGAPWMDAAARAAGAARPDAASTGGEEAGGAGAASAATRSGAAKRAPRKQAASGSPASGDRKTRARSGR